MKRLRITIDNKSYDVTVEDLTEAHSYRPEMPAAVPPPGSPPPGGAPSPAPRPQPQLPIDTGAVTSPMAGVIKSVLVKPGDTVTQSQPLVVLEAMKMENQITAPTAGKVKQIDVAAGDSVHDGQVLLVLE